MHRRGICVGLSVLFACSLAACTGSAETAQTASEGASPPPASAEVEITPIALTPHTPVWRSVEIRQEQNEGIELVVLEAGVLGKGTNRLAYYQNTDGALAPVGGLAPGYDGDVFGVWPDDAWMIAYRHAEELRYTSVSLNKLGDGNWVTQPYAGAERFELDGHRFRKSTRTMGGLLVTRNGVTERLTGSGEPLVVGAHRGELVDFFETREGKVYEEGQTFHVVVDCADEACVNEKSRALPLTDWTFTSPIARSADAISVFASTGGREFVLDGGPTGWALTEFPPGDHRPTGMWASKDGGLWIQPTELPARYHNPRDVYDMLPYPADVLWHRDPQGTWWTLAMPHDAYRMTAAVTTDQQELWIVGGLKGVGLAAFATSAMLDQAR